MRVEIPTGKYVVAVSGGVDSVVLLDLLRLHPELQLVVAHFDHGIRADSHTDRQFVAQLARRHELPYIYDVAQLGPNASEAKARQARYDFLRKTQRASGAQAIITAHHQDDVLETIIINLLRGTGRKGLSSLRSTDGLVRPLLTIPKADLLDYAHRHNLDWHEDSTNVDTSYLRNHVRHNILAKADPETKAKLINIARRMQQLNPEIDGLVAEQLSPELDRAVLRSVSDEVARELIAGWLRQYQITDFSSDTLERLLEAARSAQTGKQFDIMHGYSMRIDRHVLALQTPER